MVTMWRAAVVLTWSTMAASVVDLPDPVVPVTKTMPRGSSAMSRTASGNPSSAIFVTPYGMRRQTMEIEPR